MGNTFGTSLSGSAWEKAKSMVLLPELISLVDGVKKDPEKRKHPGTVEHIHKNCRDVLATPFDGARLMFTKGVNKHCQVSHNVSLGGDLGYRFGVTYVGDRQYNPESYPVLAGDVDLLGNLNANFIHQVSTNLLWKCTVHFEEQSLARANFYGEYRGDDYSVALSLVNPDLFSGNGAAVAHFLQSVSNNLAVGGELVYHNGPHIPGGQFSACSVVGKYTSDESVWSGTVGMNLIHLSYYQKISPQLQFGMEVQTSWRAEVSVVTVGYQMDIPDADVVFRGSADTRMNVSGVLETQLPLPVSCTFALSTQMNCMKNKFVVGCALIIE